MQSRGAADSTIRDAIRNKIKLMMLLLMTAGMTHLMTIRSIVVTAIIVAVVVSLIKRDHTLGGQSGETFFFLYQIFNKFYREISSVVLFIK